MLRFTPRSSLSILAVFSSWLSNRSSMSFRFVAPCSDVLALGSSCLWLGAGIDDSSDGGLVLGLLCDVSACRTWELLDEDALALLPPSRSKFVFYILASSCSNSSCHLFLLRSILSSPTFSNSVTILLLKSSVWLTAVVPQFAALQPKQSAVYPNLSKSSFLMLSLEVIVACCWTNGREWSPPLHQHSS